MRRLIAAFLATFVLIATATADDRAKLNVRLTPTADGLIAQFKLSEPVDAFMFAYESEGIREKTWHFADGFALQDAVLSRGDGTPFSAFEVRIEPFNEPTGAAYPCLFRVGGGFGFYAGYFLGADDAFDATIEVENSKDRIVAGFPRDASTWHVDATFHRNPGHRYVYVGPPGQLSQTRYARFVSPPEVPAALAARIRENVEGSISFYTRKLARPLPTKPLVIVVPNFDYKRPGLQGDTTMGPTVAIRIFSKGSSEFDPLDRSDHLIAHEVAHFWNSDTFHAAKRSPSWMWEGSAEIWALAARGAAMKRLTAPDRRKHIENALTSCALSLFDQPLVGKPRARTTYACGETIFWLADVAEKHRSHGRRDGFSVWRRMFDKADRNGGLYTLEDLLGFAVTSDRSARVFSLVLAGEGADRWQTLPEVVRPLGVELAKEAPAEHALRHIAMWHILNMVCESDASRGMRREADYLALDTGDKCGPLSGDPEVDTLNGHNLFTDMPAAYAAAQTACTSDGELVLTRAGKPDKVTVTCTKPLPAAPPTFRILSTP